VKAHPDPDLESRVLRGWADLVIGMVLFVACTFVLAVPPGSAGKPTISITMGLLLAAGVLTAARGVYRLLRVPRAAMPIHLEDRPGGDRSAGRRSGLGYKFVRRLALPAGQPAARHLADQALVVRGRAVPRRDRLGLQIGGRRAGRPDQPAVDRAARRARVRRRRGRDRRAPVLQSRRGSRRRSASACSSSPGSACGSGAPTSITRWR